jgi:hypothetical protein
MKSKTQLAIKSLINKKIISVDNDYVKIISNDIKGKYLTKEENQIITNLLNEK